MTQTITITKNKTRKEKDWFDEVLKTPEGRVKQY